MDRLSSTRQSGGNSPDTGFVTEGCETTNVLSNSPPLSMFDLDEQKIIDYIEYRLNKIYKNWPNVYEVKNVVLKVLDDATALTTGDGKMYFTVPKELADMQLISVGAHVYTVSSSGTPTVQIHNLTDAADILSTLITIDANEKDSSIATAPAVINKANSIMAEGDELRIDVDVAGTGTKGLEVRLGFVKY